MQVVESVLRHLVRARSPHSGPVVCRGQCAPSILFGHSPPPGVSGDGEVEISPVDR